MAASASAGSLSMEQLLDELAFLYSTRHRTLRFAPEQELTAHTRRMAELEQEYRHRMPRREVESGESDFGEEHTPSATDPAGTGRRWVQTDDRVDRPTRT